MLKRNKNKTKRKILIADTPWKVVFREQAIAIGVLVMFYVFGIVLIVLLETFGMISTIANAVWAFSQPLYWFIVNNLFTILFIAPVLVFLAYEIRLFIKKQNQIHLLLNSVESIYLQNDTEVELPDEFEQVQHQLTNIRLQQSLDQQRAKEAEQKKNDLVVYLAHDLKTPLTSVIGYLSLLDEEKGISEELRNRYIGIALQKSYRLEDLVNEFFEITRYNLQTMELDLSQINLTLLLEQLIDEFYPLLDEKNVTIDFKRELNTEEELWLDGNKMARVFDNLLKNAINYCDPNSKIEILMQETEEDIIISFTNEGNKIPAHKLEVIFEKFYRLDEARSSKTGGSGLGLAVAKKIVEQHRGKIFATSTEEKTTFTVELRKN